MRMEEGVSVVPEKLAKAVAQGVGWGGPAAAFISGLALLFSGYTFYDSNLRRADIEVFLPPVIQYARDFGGEVEVFAIPVTVSNDGASSGALLLLELEVENLASKKTKGFYSAYFGDFPRKSTAAKKAFAPIYLSGRGTYSGTVLFYPRPVEAAPRHLVDDAGKFKVTLTVKTSAAQLKGWERFLGGFWGPPLPVQMEVQLPYITQQGLDHRRDTLSMYQAGFYIPAAKPQ